MAKGVPGRGYPWQWSVYRWLEGEPATSERIADHRQFATQVADFLAALYKIDPADGPPAGRRSAFRGGPLVVYDAETRDAIAALGDEIDTDAATDLWEAAPSLTMNRPPRPRAAEGRHARRCADELVARRDGTTAGVTTRRSVEPRERNQDQPTMQRPARPTGVAEPSGGGASPPITVRRMRPARLLQRLAAGHWQNVDFNDLDSLVTALGFRRQRVSGSHHLYVHPLVDTPLNLQNVRGQAKPYQLRQLIRLVEKYDLGLEAER